MRHLLNLMTGKAMLITVDAHQYCYNALLDYYKNPQMFIADDDEDERGDTFCHVSVFGPTTHRFNGLDANCRRVRCYRDIRADIKAAVEDDSISKVLIELDGPGGEGSGCFDLADYIAEASSIKPIIGFINGGSFSANFAIGSACTELYASPHSYGGSIGAIYGREERTAEGRKITYFTSGEAKADGQPYLAMTEAEAERNQAMIDSMAGAFFELVAKHRNITAEKVKSLQANIFSAEKMLELGLVDGIKTEEEIKSMMTNATHNRIVEGIKAEHAEEVQALTATNTSLKDQLTELQQEATEAVEYQTNFLNQVNALAKSAGVGDIVATVVAESADLEAAKEKIKQEAANREEEISLTGSVNDANDGESYDMQQLIKDA